jgi:hypothetical protein
LHIIDNGTLAKQLWLRGVGVMRVPGTLENLSVDPDVLTALMQAFNAVCRELEIDDRTHLLAHIVAQKVVEAAINGERDPDLLCRMVVDGLGFHAVL